MGWLRAGLRVPTVVLATVFFYSLFVAGSLVVRPWQRTAIRWRDAIFRTWARTVLRVLGVEVVVRGTPPAPPFFLVSNHLSYLDIPVIASRLDAVFVAKSEIASWPFLGTLCRGMSTIFIDRESRRDLPRAMRLIDHHLGFGQGVVVFPEGTSTQGAGVQRFQPSLLEVAARNGRPVHHAALSYRSPERENPTHLAVCWWGGMGFTSHFLEMARLSRITASLTFGAEPIRERDRKRLADRLRGAVIRDFEPVVPAEEACRQPSSSRTSTS